VRYFNYAIGSFAITYIVLVAFICFARLDFVMVNVTEWDEFGRLMYLVVALGLFTVVAVQES
jgi:hypothetical protein